MMISRWWLNEHLVCDEATPDVTKPYIISQNTLPEDEKNKNWVLVTLNCNFNSTIL